MFIIFLSFILLYVHSVANATTMHVFGDSHASFYFSNERTAIPRNEHSFFLYNGQEKNIRTEWSIHWLGSRTMFRMGRDRLGALDLKNCGVKNSDVAIFVFGEIDVRCHLGKQQKLQNRCLEDIIADLVTNFITTIEQNRKKFDQLYCVIVSIVPPTDNMYNQFYPYYGSLQERVNITRLLNTALDTACHQNPSYTFLDIYPLYATAEGYLDNRLSDGVVHVNSITNDTIKNKLLDLLQKKYHLF